MHGKGGPAPRTDPLTGPPGVEVLPLVTRGDRRAWLDLPERIQGNDRAWIAPLRIEQAKLLDRRRNVFFRRGEAEFFLAWRGGVPVGRVSAHTGLPMAGQSGAPPGTFGFFECADDPEAAAALFAAAERWLAGRRAVRVLGPMNFDMNHECGLLVEGFDSPPFLMMGHNPSRYGPLIEACGYRKARDLYAWRYETGRIPPEMHRLADRTRRSSGLRIRPLDPDAFDRDARTVLQIFNSAWSENWGFTPMVAEDFDHAVRELRRIVRPGLILIVERHGTPIAVAVSLPNLNEALAGLRGRLFPFGFLRLLWRLKVRPPRTARCLMLGIEAAERGFGTPGLSALLYVEMDRAGQRAGIAWGELSWTLEDNHAINRAMEAIGARRYKTYRIYEKEIGA